MATVQQYHIGGPTRVYYGGTTANDLLGQSDGQVLVEVQKVRPKEPVTTDARGGQPEDFIQLGAHDLIVLTLVKFDMTDVMKAAIGDLIISAGVTSYADLLTGDAPAVGLLSFADLPEGSTPILKIETTKLSAANGLGDLQWNNAIFDPETTWTLNQIGARAGLVQLAFRAHPDAQDKLMVITPVAA